MKTIIIIGAGPAGLTAALELSKDKEKYNIIIIEEEDAVGGISKTVELSGNRMDLGGHRFFSKDKRVLEIWESLLPFENENDPDKVMLKRSRVSRIFYRSKFFDYPVKASIKTLLSLGFFKSLRIIFGYIKARIKTLPEKDLESFYVNQFGRPLYSTFFESYTEKLWGRHPSRISADWGAQRVKGLSLKELVFDSFRKLFKRKNQSNTKTSLIEEFSYPKLGPGQLWEEAAEAIKKNGAKLIYGEKVVRINSFEGRLVSVITDKGKEYKGDIFISSMPLKDLLCNDSSTPDDIRAIANSLPYRDFITLGLLFDKRDCTSKLINKNGLIKDCWIYVQDPEVKLGRIQIFNNWSPYMVKNGSEIWLGLEYFCDEGDSFWRMDPEKRTELAVKELYKIGLIKKESRPKLHHTEKVKKAYPAYFDGYSQIDRVYSYLNSIDNLFCIGRNGLHRYNNMDHSMLTALEAVKNIKENVTSKENVFNVNTEKEYHEEK